MRKKTMMLLAVPGLSLVSIYALASIAVAQGDTNGTITISRSTPSRSAA